MKRKNPFHWLSIVLTLGWLSVGSVSAGQAENEEGLEMLLFMDVPEVVTSTLNQTSSIKAPSAMTVITQNEIRRGGSKTLMELLEKVPGILVNLEHFGRQVITLRGVSSEHFDDKYKLMVNGHTITEPIWGSFSDFYDIPLENVKQVEIIRGPGSSLYGTNAFAGVINVITLSPSAVNGTHVDVKAGDFGRKQGEVTYGKGDEETSFGFDLSYVDTDGPDEIIASDRLFGTPLTKAPGDLKEGAEAKRARVDFEHKKLKISAGYSDTESEMPIPQLGFLTENGEQKRYKYGYLETQYRSELSDHFAVTPKISYDSIDYKDDTQAFPKGFIIPFDIDGDGDLEYWPNGASAKFGYKSAELRTQLLFDYQATDTNKLLLGLFYEKMETKDVFFEAELHPVFLFNVDRMSDFSDTFNWNKDADRKVTGVFFQDEWTMNEDWYLIVGGRYDHYSDFGSTFNPRGGLVWDFNHKGGVLKFLWGTAFKAPTFSELYNQNNPSVVGNPNLDPETLTSGEISLDYIFAGKLQTTTTVYSLKTEDLVDVSSVRDFSKPSAPLFFVNRGETKSQGLEFEWKYAFKENNYVYGSYVYTKAEDELTNEDLPLVPESQTTLGFNLHFLEHWNWNTHVDYTGELERELSDPRAAVDSRSVVDTTLRYEDFHGWDFYVSLYNLFDEEVFSPIRLNEYPLSDFPRPGSNWAAGTSVKF